MSKKLSPEEAKKEALETALTTIERKFGQGAVMKLSDHAHLKVPAIPSGSISLDLALGVGGIPKGRVTEIFGPESSGKTTLALHVIAEAQKQGGVAAFIDAEHALDVDYAKKLGVKTDELLISQPDYGEQALEIADLLVRSGGVDVVVVDSVAALFPRLSWKEKWEKPRWEARPGLCPMPCVNSQVPFINPVLLLFLSTRLE